MTHRIERTVTSISWIPSEAVKGMTRLSFDTGVAHYDVPPPDVIDDLIALRDADRFRFANQLTAWIDVADDGSITGYGYAGRGHIGSTTMRLGGARMTFAAVALPDQQHEPILQTDSVRFVQTAGGRTGVPAPRRVGFPPFVQVAAPLAWTTLALTITADGSSTHEVLGASPFPRHWIYDNAGRLNEKSGIINFKEWYLTAFGAHTPWGGEESPALVTQVETALERELSTHIMRRGGKPRVRELKAGSDLVRQGDSGRELFLLLDGVLGVDVDGATIAHVGPGAVLGERAVIEGGMRTSTLRAVTRCRVAEAAANDIDQAFLQQLAAGHRREEAVETAP